MFFLKSLLITGISFIFLALIFSPLERVFPAQPDQKIFRKQWILDLMYFLGQYLFWSSLVLAAVNYINGYFTGFIPLSVTETINAQPTWLKVIEAILFSDLLIYWGHRLQHHNDFLWRFHKIHHSAKRLDWLAAHREHPLDSIYTIGLINLPLFIIGFPLELIAGVVAFRGIWAIYIHSNVRIQLGFFKKIVGSPELHHWHHDLERDRGNYANLSPLMDILFGTYTCPDHEPKAVGIKEGFSENYIGQMISPLLPKGTWERWESKVKSSKKIQK